MTIKVDSKLKESIIYQINSGITPAGVGLIINRSESFVRTRLKEWGITPQTKTKSDRIYYFVKQGKSIDFIINQIDTSKTYIMFSLRNRLRDNKDIYKEFKDLQDKGKIHESFGGLGSKCSIMVSKRKAKPKQSVNKGKKTLVANPKILREQSQLKVEQEKSKIRKLYLPMISKAYRSCSTDHSKLLIEYEKKIQSINIKYGLERTINQ